MESRSESPGNVPLCVYHFAQTEVLDRKHLQTGGA